MIVLTEGLRMGDLKNLVLPVLSIDEYKSKIADDSEVIVVGFFVKDQEPAEDLTRFIERGEIDTLDVETSPAPNEDGNYIVFTEVTRDENFPKLFINLIKSIEGLTGEMEWEFKPYHHIDIVKLSVKNIKKFIELDRNVVLKKEKEKKAKDAEEAKKKRKEIAAHKEKIKKEQELQKKTNTTNQPSVTPVDVSKESEGTPAVVPVETNKNKQEEEPKAKPKGKKESIEDPKVNLLMEFFRPSDINHLEINTEHKTVQIDNQEYKLVSFGKLNKLMERYNVPFDFSVEGIAAARKLSYRLGASWDVQRIPNGFVMARGHYGLIVKDLM